jgi:hypothetical protein
MAKTTILARDWKHYIEDIATPDTFVEIGALSSFEPSPSAESADNSNFNNGGWASSLPASRGMEYSLEGKYIVDAATKDRDAGQELVEEAAVEVGTAAVRKYRVKDPAGNIVEFQAWATMGNKGGGGVNDTSAWACTLNVVRKPTLITGVETPVRTYTDAPEYF